MSYGGREKACSDSGGEYMDIQRQIIYRQIGAKIAYYRALRSVSQEKLAARMGVNKSVISRIERGKYHNDISLSTLLDIAEHLKIDPAMLLTFSDMEKRLWWEPLDLSAQDDDFGEA